MTVERERIVIPPNVYYSADPDNFYNAMSGEGMGADFYNEWQGRKHLFPTSATGAIVGASLGTIIAVHFRGRTIAGQDTEELAKHIDQEFRDLSARADALEHEIRGAWQRLEDSCFPPEAMGWPHIDLKGMLPEAIDNALSALIRAREDMMRERDQAKRDRQSMLAGMVAGASFMGVLAATLRVDQQHGEDKK